MSDLKHVLQMQSGVTEPHMQISAITFFGLADLEHGMEQMRKCLHSDPESKKCKKLHRREKVLSKALDQVNKHLEKHQYSGALKLLLPSGEDVGLVQDIKDDVKELRESGTIPKQSPNELEARVVEMVCESYHEVSVLLHC
jgi:DnaJ family protein C protein 3